MYRRCHSWRPLESDLVSSVRLKWATSGLLSLKGPKYVYVQYGKEAFPYMASGICSTFECVNHAGIHWSAAKLAVGMWSLVDREKVVCGILSSPGSAVA